MTGAFDTTPIRLTETASDCDKTAAQFAAELAALNTYVRSFEGLWVGATSLNFEATMATYQQHATNLNTALTQIAAGLRSNANNYTVGEHDNAQLIAGVGGDLRPANLG